MSSSGLIYAVIVGLWAAYLVPMWLRRQDELAEAGAQQDRLFTAVRVLTRRPSSVAGGSGEDAGYPAVRDDAGSVPAPARRRAPAAKASTAGRAGVGTGAPRRSRRRAALLARRRRVVSVLFLTFTVGSALTAAYGSVWVGLPAVTGLLLSLYIVYLRRQERRRAELRQRRRPRPGQARRRYRPGTLAGKTPAAARTAAYQGSPEDREGADDSWEPVPVPLPTYVTAPVAPGTKPWTYQAPAVKSGAAAAADTGEDTAVYDQYRDLDDHPRAVND